MVLPEAKTSADKLEMKGEKVDLNNIKNTIQGDLEGFGKRAQNLEKNLAKEPINLGKQLAKKEKSLAKQLPKKLHNLPTKQTQLLVKEAEG